MCQLCELRKLQLVGAHLRMFAIRREVDVMSYKGRDDNTDSDHELRGVNSFQTCLMKTNHDFSGDGAMLLFLPQLIIHEIDAKVRTDD